jgi:hypothetical protein
MKTRFILFFALAAMFAFPSCDEDILDINESFTYTHEIEVSTTDTAMSVAEVIDMSEQDELIEKYGDKIETIEITEVKYWLTTFDGDEDQEIIEATVSVAKEDGSNEELIATIQNQILSQIVGEDNEQVLTVEQAGIDQMANLVKNSPHKFMLAYDFACNKGPLEFKVKFEFTIKMVANPL